MTWRFQNVFKQEQLYTTLLSNPTFLDYSNGFKFYVNTKGDSGLNSNSDVLEIITEFHILYPILYNTQGLAYQPEIMFYHKQVSYNNI